MSVLSRVGLAVATLFLISCAVLLTSKDPQDLDRARPAHHTDEGFRNLYIESAEKSPFSFLMMKFFGDTPFSDQAAEAHLVPVAEPAIESIHDPADKVQLSWLGHSSFLIQYAGLNLLTDPILSDRASPVSFAGPKRLVVKPIELEDLPSIDFVVISHNHYDHLDIKTIRTLANQAQFIVPLKLKDWFVSLDVPAAGVYELDWWQSFSASNIEFTATPSQHWSARGLFDRNKTLWAAWHIRIDNFTLWFGGDTGYNPVQFKEVARKLGAVDLGLIPVGAYSPRWFMGPQHVNPEEAVKIHQDIQATRSIGMHWGTFQLTAEPMMEPVERLQKARLAAKLRDDEFFTMAIGETLVIPKG